MCMVRAEAMQLLSSKKRKVGPLDTFERPLYTKVGLVWWTMAELKVVKSLSALGATSRLFLCQLR
jgi:hypothetical protein